MLPISPAGELPPDSSNPPLCSWLDQAELDALGELLPLAGESGSEWLSSQPDSHQGALPHLFGIENPDAFALAFQQQPAIPQPSAPAAVPSFFQLSPPSFAPASSLSTALIAAPAKPQDRRERNRERRRQRDTDPVHRAASKQYRKRYDAKLSALKEKIEGKKEQLLSLNRQILLFPQAMGRNVSLEVCIPAEVNNRRHNSKSALAAIVVLEACIAIAATNLAILQGYYRLYPPAGRLAIQAGL